MSAVSLFYRRHDDALNHDVAKTAFAALTDGVAHARPGAAPAWSG